MTAVEMMAEAVYQAMSETFEGMAFVQITRPEEETPVSHDENQMWSRVDVKRPDPGFLLVAYSEEIGAQIVESLYGLEDEECTEEIMEDALKEIVNTVVGRCMSLLVAEGETFELGLPETGRGWPDIGDAEVFPFKTMDEGTLTAAAKLTPREGAPIWSKAPRAQSPAAGRGEQETQGDDWGGSGGGDDWG